MTFYRKGDASYQIACSCWLVFETQVGSPSRAIERNMSQTSSAFSGVSGDGYELQMGRWGRLLAGRFLDFTGLTDSGRVLDAGCGTGALSGELLRRTIEAQIVGIDISPAHIAHAAASTEGPRIGFATGDLTAPAFPDAEFDQVYSQLVLQFVPKSWPRHQGVGPCGKTGRRSVGCSLGYERRAHVQPVLSRHRCNA